LLGVDRNSLTIERASQRRTCLRLSTELGQPRSARAPRRRSV
jgi:hypothetical protein